MGKKTVGRYRTEEEAIEAYAEEKNVQLETEQFLIQRQIQEEAEEVRVVGSGQPRIVTHARTRPLQESSSPRYMCEDEESSDTSTIDA